MENLINVAQLIITKYPFVKSPIGSAMGAIVCSLKDAFKNFRWNKKRNPATSRKQYEEKKMPGGEDKISFSRNVKALQTKYKKNPNSHLVNELMTCTFKTRHEDTIQNPCYVTTLFQKYPFLNDIKQSSKSVHLQNYISYKYIFILFGSIDYDEYHGGPPLAVGPPPPPPPPPRGHPPPALPLVDEGPPLPVDGDGGPPLPPPGGPLPPPAQPVAGGRPPEVAGDGGPPPPLPGGPLPPLALQAAGCLPPPYANLQMRAGKGGGRCRRPRSQGASVKNYNFY
ncbi:PREDICTED: uncharacterized protein LOC105313118 [Amphimedon queenslandica]|uniref:Uncharacterized protein n=1 Tax=Amphimedon queenslandica TaxID=400682 RepID=A0AAN0IMC3_AMPQE|nr:PREDICTED: uncharacterized protein LOC105313118 [Amphimedon queenslandica]|eukprot:XP_011404589.1 PREDICTED: uncharacterized protein LOC105313118 [Amphimedon queenslandica]